MKFMINIDQCSFSCQIKPFLENFTEGNPSQSNIDNMDRWR